VDDNFAERRALLLAMEADWAGVWEVLWALSTARPKLSVGERERLATNALRHLHELGYITFVRAPWPGPTDRGEHKALSGEDIDLALDDQGWRQDPPTADVWFSVTDEGEAAFLAGI